MTETLPLRNRRELPFPVYNFEVAFADSRPEKPADPIAICGGAFSECTGLEATMEPKVIKAGGQNYGVTQRAGPVTFATVVLKRGITSQRDLWRWFEMISRRGAYAYRLTATIHVKDAKRQTVLSWKLDRAMPVKFKASDLNAKGTDVGVEELHIVHEGLSLETPAAGSRSAGAITA